MDNWETLVDEATDLILDCEDLEELHDRLDHAVWLQCDWFLEATLPNGFPVFGWLLLSFFTHAERLDTYKVDTRFSGFIAALQDSVLSFGWRMAEATPDRIIYRKSDD